MGSKHKGSKEQRSALSAFINLQRAASSLSHRIMPSLSSAGLTEGQFGVIEALFHLGPMCQSELAKKILRTPANITVVIDNLELSGLVSRQRSANDRRYIVISLTDKGRALVEQIFPRHAQEIVKQFSVLSIQEQEQLRALCRKLGKQERDS